MPLWRKRCLCLRAPKEDVDVLDYSRSGLTFIPSDVFKHERTLEELYVDNNRIRDLPREVFYCQSLRRLSIAENEVTEIPPVIGSLVNLEHLDISKNAIGKIPDGVDACKRLKVFEASVNPLEGLSDGLCRLIQLQELYLNDCFLDYLPDSFGRLGQLKILELRENRLRSLPSSMSAMGVLERLDVGMNQLSQMPEVVGSLFSLQEFWFDSNDISHLPEGLGKLTNLTFLDGSRNRIEWIAPELDQCTSLHDLDLSHNNLQTLPESFGRLSCLSTVRLENNCLIQLPFSIGGLASLTDLDISVNNLEEIPIGVGMLRRLRTFLADDNFLISIPSAIGSCSSLTILSLRSNNLTYIPDEVGQLANLKVLSLSDNKLATLPCSLLMITGLKALWLAEGQSKPLTRLQSDVDPKTGTRFLTSYLLPQELQKPFEGSDDMNSFHPSVWEEERNGRCQIQFNFQDAPPEQSQLYRTPTPYPKELKQRIQHIRNLATMQARGDFDKQEVVAGRRMQRMSNTSLVSGNSLSPSKSSAPSKTGQHDSSRADKHLKIRATIHQRDEKENIAKTVPVAQYIAESSERQQTDVHRATNRNSLIESNGTNLQPDYYISKEKVVTASEATVRSLKTSNSGNVKTTNMDDKNLRRMVSAKQTLPSKQNAEPSQSCSAGAAHTDVCSSPSAVEPGIEIMSFKEFAANMAAQGRCFPKGGVNRDRAHRPTAYVHHSRPSSSGRRRGYDSETGYRSDVGQRHRHGHESDTGYRSEIGYRSEVGYRGEADSHRTNSGSFQKPVRWPSAGVCGNSSDAGRRSSDRNSSGEILYRKSGSGFLPRSEMYEDEANQEHRGFVPSNFRGFSGSEQQLTAKSRPNRNTASSGNLVGSRSSSSVSDAVRLSRDGMAKTSVDKPVAHRTIREENETVVGNESRRRFNDGDRRSGSQQMESRQSLLNHPNVTHRQKEGSRSQEVENGRRTKNKNSIPIEL